MTQSQPAATAVLLGSSGKLGAAMRAALHDDFRVVTATSRDGDARDPAAVEALLRAHAPQIVVNCVAKMGIPACEQDPLDAFRLNTALPGQLADLSRALGFKLVHFSTDSVFADRAPDDGGAYVESDAARPLNTYGITKFGGDCHVQARAVDFLLVRISVLFGPSPKGNQFVERMLGRVLRGDAISVAHDVIGSPSYSVDVAQRVRAMIRDKTPSGLYHVANVGQPSLHELMVAAKAACAARAQTDGSGGALTLGDVRAVSHESFPSLGVKNRCTPIATKRAFPLRTWQDALAAYCAVVDLDDLRRLP